MEVRGLQPRAPSVGRTGVEDGWQGRGKVCRRTLQAGRVRVEGSWAM